VSVPTVEVRGLHTDIAGAHILQGLDLVVPTGAVTALLGRNGVGKTTTLRSILGLTPSRGRIRIQGREVSGWPTHRIIQLGVGYVPEDRDVFAGLTVAENLKLAERTSTPDYEHVYELFPDLKERAGQKAGFLSGGQQQMLAIARTLLSPLHLLVLDEPTKGLAPKLVEEVVAVVAKMQESSTILLVEQNVSVVRRLAHHVVVLEHGAVVHTGNVSDLDDPQLVRRLVGVGSAA
jgi:branched-chain amino acid transport system ATP-binding protein